MILVSKQSSLPTLLDKDFIFPSTRTAEEWGETLYHVSLFIGAMSRKFWQKLQWRGGSRSRS